jgi:hypothetical protein
VLKFKNKFGRLGLSATGGGGGVAP